MALIIDGKDSEVPGLTTRSWKDNPVLALKHDKDCTNRSGDSVRQIILHTTKGWPDTPKDPKQQKILPGFGLGGNAEKVAAFWAGSDTQAGAHIVVDFDGSVACLADLKGTAAFHCKHLNQSSIGIEIYQGSSAELYHGQLLAVVVLVDYLTRVFGIQRQFAAPYLQHSVVRLSAGGAPDCYGVFGHRDASNNRGPGDPGDEIFRILKAAGYEAFDFINGEDRRAWMERQQNLRVVAPKLSVDGVPGPNTVGALKRTGNKWGMWVERPGD